MSYPPIKPGTRVRTRKVEGLSNEWTEYANAQRQFGVEGVVGSHHDSHGLCYDVRHNDGTEAAYDPEELVVLDPVLKEGKYKKLTIRHIDSQGEIWVSDDEGHLVQKEYGTMKTALLPGKYRVQFSLQCKGFEIELLNDMIIEGAVVIQDA